MFFIQNIPRSGYSMYAEEKIERINQDEDEASAEDDDEDEKEQSGDDDDKEDSDQDRRQSIYFNFSSIIFKDISRIGIHHDNVCCPGLCQLSCFALSTRRSKAGEKVIKSPI